MKFGKIFEASAAAAALAACSPAEKAPTQETNPQEEVLKQVGSSDTYEVAEPDAAPNPDDVTITSREGGAEDALVTTKEEYRASGIGESDGLDEPDGMTSEEIAKLQPPE